MIELRQLNSFVAVAEELHFARAAERLHIAQPAVSMQVKALEQQLDVRLLERSKRSVALTAAGVLFLEQARLTLRQARHAEEVGRQAGRAERGRIAIGYSSSVPFTRTLAAILRAFSASHPGVELTLTALTAPEQSEGLENGTLDFGLFRCGYAAQRPGVLMTPLLRERYDVVMSSSHRLAACDLVPMAELAEESFIAYSSAMMSPLHDICRCAGFTPRIAQTVSQITTIVSLAAAGLGVAIVPHSLSQLHFTDAAFRSLAIDDISMLAFACRRNEQAPATLALIQEAKRFAAKMAAGYGQPASPLPATCGPPGGKMTRPALGELPLAAPFPPSES
jgi:DNA-binding transcriptional LysR family regulator